MSLPGAKDIPSLCSEQAAQSRMRIRRLLRVVRNDNLLYEMATLPSVARHDNIITITQAIDSVKKGGLKLIDYPSIQKINDSSAVGRIFLGMGDLNDGGPILVQFFE
jgi:hypothetical protein